MNELKATRAKLKCLEMVEGTGLEWREVVRDRFTKAIYVFYPSFVENDGHYEFALGVVEGKPVWKGDEVHTINGKHIASGNEADWFWSQCSWNPPAPKTIMVELPIEDVEFYSNIKVAELLGTQYPNGRLELACKKALESAKCK